MEQAKSGVIVMHLLTVLASGVTGCEGGYALVSQRGTAQPATCYTDFEGLTAVASTTTQHTLDSDGRAVLYVDEVVDIVPYTSAGVAQTGWTEGVSGAAVEYNGQSFTGTDYDDASTGADKPVMHRTLLNKWKDSAGAIDWKVQADVAATPATMNLKSIGVTVGMTWYCVTDPVYGAKGDGSTDDAAAIQAAIDAAELAGGGVVLLPPTSTSYVIGAALVNDADGVTIEGIGNPTIEVNSSTVNGFTLTGDFTTLRGFTIKVKDSVGADNSGDAINATATADLTIDKVQVLASATSYYFAQSFVKATSGIRLRITDCVLQSSSASGTGVAITGSATQTYIYNTTIFATGAGAVGLKLTDQTEGYLSGNSITGGSATGYALGLVTSAVTSNGNAYISSGAGPLNVDATSVVQSGGDEFGSVLPTLAAGSGRKTSTWSQTRQLKGGDIASATDITLTTIGFVRTYDITGTTAITTISDDGAGGVASFYEGQEITLYFDGVLTFTDTTGNIELNGAADFTTATGDSITLKFLNANWHEVGRNDTG